MQCKQRTLIWRHRKENIKKCSLQPLLEYPTIDFVTYPQEELPDYQNYILLTLDAPVLSKKDGSKNLLIVDGTWRYAKKMIRQLDLSKLTLRSLPSHIQTAYPRKQEDCPDPERGLASIEALYTAYTLLGWDRESLLNHYYWKDAFLKLNRGHLAD